MKRRSLLANGVATLAATTVIPRFLVAQAPPEPAIRIGACVVGLAQAKQAGLQGVEVGVGSAADTLEIATEAVRQRYHDQMKASGLPVCSLMMGLLNSCPLATDPRAPAWLGPIHRRGPRPGGQGDPGGFLRKR